ncbi:MAG TPA: FMN-binding protein [Rectinemataceae bacterium]|nr:FMN-binding protein [Rectinemataceae bacterium]
MKRIIALTVILSLALAGTAFAQIKAKDGVYFAQETGFSASSGWKEAVVVTVAGGKIAKVAWNGVSNLGLADKKTVAAAGGYGMKKASKLGLEWDQEAANVEAYLVKTQDLGFSKFNAKGETDAISGASLTVKNFFDLVNKALASAPVPKGIYAKDGWYFAEQSAFDKQSGWKDNVLVTVVNGSVVDVLWNGVYKDKTKKSKLVEALAGRYGMGKVAKKGEWNVQAAAVQDAILKVQDPAKIALKNDGTTDAISGASIHVAAVSLAVEALKAAR